MILVDTSVWIDHFRIGEPDLARALTEGEVFIHPFVIGELAMGHLQNRATILQLLQDLPPAPVASDQEAIFFLEKHQLFGQGIGYIDLHLLASVILMGNGRLWTKDKRLSGVAEAMRLSIDPV